MSSFEKIAVSRVSARSGLRLITKNSREHIKRFIRQEFPEQILEDIWSELQRDLSGWRPDAWDFVPRGVICRWPCIVAIEIEDTWRITREKLDRLSHFWFACDSESIEFFVVCFDRYGNFVDTLDLLAHSNSLARNRPGEYLPDELIPEDIRERLKRRYTTVDIFS